MKMVAPYWNNLVDLRYKVVWTGDRDSYMVLVVVSVAQDSSSGTVEGRMLHH